MNKKLRHWLVPGLQPSVAVEGNIDYALNLWKSKMKSTGVMREMRDRTYYEKPSIKRRRQRQYAVYRNSINSNK